MWVTEVKEWRENKDWVKLEVDGYGTVTLTEETSVGTGESTI